MIISSEVVSLISNSFVSDEWESGGLLGQRDGIICAFVHDKSGACLGEYTPNVSLFNKILKEWTNEGIEFAGIIHSHPNDCRVLSPQDEKSIVEIYEAVECNLTLYFPIVTICNKEKIITPYKCENGSISTDELIVA